MTKETRPSGGWLDWRLAGSACLLIPGAVAFYYVFLAPPVESDPLPDTGVIAEANVGELELLRVLREHTEAVRPRLLP